jgi:Tat protein translocase TatB subunit
VPFNLGTGELLLILFVALLVLGPTKLPDAARQVGRAMTEFRRMSSGFQAELRDALREPVDGVPRTAATEPVPPQAPSAPPAPTIEDPDADHEGSSGPSAA